ncbi:MAG TPA: hypothetical protein VFW03_09135 [Gemmatimonadaceae bacterium]|nr:hypothetical protein [Gemmatimonadaceae bacterium]
MTRLASPEPRCAVDECDRPYPDHVGPGNVGHPFVASPEPREDAKPEQRLRCVVCHEPSLGRNDRHYHYEPIPEPREDAHDHIAWAQHVRSEHEATHGEAEQCGAACIVLGLAEFDE